MTTFKITDDKVGIRLDKVITDYLKDKTRTYVLKCIEDGKILVNNKTFKPSLKASLNDEITILDIEPKELTIEAKDMNLDIIYEDDDVLIVNKPKGMVVHPGAGNYDNTMVNGLLYEMDDLPEINGVLRPGIVHRIDKDTTGLVMVANTEQAMISLSAQLHNHTCNSK